MTNQPQPRPTVRVLLIDSEDRIFLLHANAEFRGGDGPVWITPGGGLEAGEDFDQAAARELKEEVGLTDVPLGACVWLRSLPYFMDGQARVKQERYYICQVELFEVDWSAVDMDESLGGRWWSLDEIEASSELFVPRALAMLLRPILRGELPPTPIEVAL